MFSLFLEWNDLHNSNVPHKDLNWQKPLSSWRKIDYAFPNLTKSLDDDLVQKRVVNIHWWYIAGEDAWIGEEIRASGNQTRRADPRNDPATCPGRKVPSHFCFFKFKPKAISCHQHRKIRNFLVEFLFGTLFKTRKLKPLNHHLCFDMVGNNSCYKWIMYSYFVLLTRNWTLFTCNLIIESWHLIVKNMYQCVGRRDSSLWCHHFSCLKLNKMQPMEM